MTEEITTCGCGWKPIATAPKDGTKVDIWMQVNASPMSMGLSDSFRVVECAWSESEVAKEGPGWYHYDQSKSYDFRRLQDRYITHWMLTPDAPKEREL